MKTIKGPAIFLAQFMGAEVPFDNLANLAGWAARAISSSCAACQVRLTTNGSTLSTP